MPVVDLELHPAALEDARDGYAWYLERSPRVADAFLAELDRGLRLIAATPESWPPDLFGARHYVLRKYPYSIVYKAAGSSIVVYAFAHAKRKPGYWKNRIG
jgi:plasmid stabilization system protein ParE